MRKTLADLGLRDEGRVVLGIYRPGRSYVGVPKGQTRALPGDLLILYGRASLLAEPDRRSAGSAGDHDHNEAVARQADVMREQGAGRARR